MRHDKEKGGCEILGLQDRCRINDKAASLTQHAAPLRGLRWMSPNGQASAVRGCLRVGCMR